MRRSNVSITKKSASFGFSSVLLLAALVSTLLLRAIPTESKTTKTWTVYHRLLSPPAVVDGMSAATTGDLTEWNVRGTIELSVQDDDTETYATATGAADMENYVTIQMKNADDALSERLAQSLTKSTSPGSFYQLKLVDESSSNGEVPPQQQQEVLTSVPACHVRRANFRDEFVVQLQPGTGRALSISYMPLISPLAPPTCDAYDGQLPSTTSTTTTSLQFESKISWETAVPGMVVGKPPPVVVTESSSSKQPEKLKPPPGLKWIPGAQRKSAAGGGDDPLGPETTPPPTGMFGLFTRYWYIFLPMMVINMMGGGGGGSEEPPQPPGSAAVAAAAGGAAAVAAAASGGGGSPARQRRGKRD